MEASDEVTNDDEGTESTAESEGVVLGSPSSRPGSRNITGVRRQINLTSL